MQDFSALRPEEGMSWLQEHCPKAHALATSFLAKYGHRVIREVCASSQQQLAAALPIIWDRSRY